VLRRCERRGINVEERFGGKGSEGGSVDIMERNFLNGFGGGFVSETGQIVKWEWS
jgi:hypothetical protein